MKNLMLLIAAMIFFSCQESLEDRCEKELREYTKKKCPAEIAENTFIDSITFDRQTHTIHYHYTLSGMADNADLISKANPRDLLIKEIRNSTSSLIYKENGYSFEYTYRSKKNPKEILFNTIVTKKDYEKK